MSRPRFLSTKVVALQVVGLILTMATAAVAEGGALFERGEALYFGQAPLAGKPRGHDSFMPAEVVRCVNCHGDGPGTRVLDRALLLQPRQRRLGPPSAYDETSFCKMLQTGIDPVAILIDHQMPIYRLDPPDCAALFTYLTNRELHHAS